MRICIHLDFGFVFVLFQYLLFPYAFGVDWWTLNCTIHQSSCWELADISVKM